MAGDTLFLPVMQERKIYVLGAVKAAKTIEYREGLKVMDAILEAGGFSKYADQNAVTVRRKNGAETSSFTVKAKSIVKDGDLSQNLELQSGDYVLVPEGFL